MGDENQQKKIEKIREYVLKSGFPSEIEIGNILRKNGWIVGNQWPYVDKESSKIRAVDVYAMRLGLQPPGLGISLLIECKKSIKHDWVFHTQKKEGEFLPGLWTIIDFLKKLSKPPLSDKLKELTADGSLYSLLGLQHPSLVALDKLAGLHVPDKAIKLGVLNVIPSSKDDFSEAT